MEEPCHGTRGHGIVSVRISEIEVNITRLRLRAHSVPTTIIDIGTRLVEDWSWRTGIHDAGESDLIASCFMFEGCFESPLRFMMAVMLPSMMIGVIHELIKIAVTMWAEHVEVTKGQEGVSNDALCTRR